jgi:CubicO group peptidase (beta-lactamase class C family)
MEDYIIKSLEFWNVPGASIAIVKGNEIVLAKGFGYTNLQKTSQVDGNTLFPIASLTKSFSAIACGMFAEEQQISLDATIQSLWPSFKLSDDYATSHLSLRDCLSMRAGLTGHDFPDGFWDQSHLTEEMLLKSLSTLTMPSGFRGCFAYQNLLYNVVSHVVEITTGMPWEQFVKQHLLDNLKMSSTTTNHAAFLNVQNKALPHQWKGDTIIEVPFERLDVISAAAGLSSNAQDMAKWLKFLLDKNITLLEGDTVVNPEMFFEEVWMEKLFFPKSHSLTYGMGWFIHDYEGVVIYQDPGLTDGMNGMMALVPELDLGIVVLSNLEAPFFSHSVLFQLIDHYRKENNDWNQIFLELRKTH